MSELPNYLKYYDVETYLLGVGDRFREIGELSPQDLYFIFMWKANRAKNRHRDRLRAEAGSFHVAVDQIASALTAAASQKERLGILMRDWGFRLPTATAILTILYPLEFTVYDQRVRDELGLNVDASGDLFSDALWAAYEEFKALVISATPPELSLRDKDRYLMARSIWHGVERDCRC